MTSTLYRPINYPIDDTTLRAFCTRVTNVDCSINALQVLGELDPTTSEIMRKYITNRAHTGIMGIYQEEFICIMNALHGFSPSPMYRFTHYSRNNFLQEINRIVTNRAVIVFIGRTDQTGHFTVFARSSNNVIHVIDPQMQQPTQVFGVVTLQTHSGHFPTLDEYMASEQNANAFAILSKRMVSKKKIRKEQFNATTFLALPDDRKLQMLKDELSNIDQMNCWIYAAKLDRYIISVNRDYTTFVARFNKDDVDKMLTLLRPDYCKHNMYNSVVPWLKQARIHIVEYTEYLRLSENDQLNFLKTVLGHIDRTTCGFYVKMLHNYIQKVGTNYAPFISKFTHNNILTMKRNLKPQSCPRALLNTYNLVVPWLDQALNHINNKYLNLNNDRKLSWLRTELGNIGPTNCGLYALVLDKYIHSVGGNYAPFIETFTADDVLAMERKLRSDQCPDNTYNSVVPWLKQAHGRLIVFNKFRLVPDNQKLSQLKEYYSDRIDSTNCAFYANMLDIYIKNVGNDYGPFKQTFTVPEIQTIIQKLRACHKNQYNVIIRWLKNVVDHNPTRANL
jgi:hypothetical protein